MTWVVGSLRRIVDTVATLVRSLARHDVIGAANSMAFDAFLSLIPLLAMAGWVISALHQSSDLVSGLLGAAPGPVAQLVDGQFLRLSEGGVATLAPISAVGFLWVSSAGLSTAMGVFEKIFFAVPRSWYLRRGLAVGFVVAAMAFVVLVAALTFLVASALGSAAAAIVVGAAPTLLLLAGLVVFFRVAVHRPSGMRRRVLPGAVATLVLWATTTALFSFYVTKLAGYATFYGSLAAVAILLFWLWLLSVALLVGGEVNAQLEGVRDPAWITSKPNDRRK